MKKLILSVLLVTALASAAFAAYGVKVTAASKFNFKDGGFEAEVVTPKVSGMSDKKAQDKLNSDFAEDSRELIDEFKREVEKTKKEAHGAPVHIGLKSAYQIRTNTKNILSFSVYVLNTAGSSSTEQDFYTFDKKTGKQLELKSLFKKNSDYVSAISRYIKAEMDRRNKKEITAFWKEGDIPEPFKKIDNDHDFYINSKGQIVICFDKYEVGPGSTGTPEFAIPAKVIKSLVAK